ncbi:unnamed protein product, partial [Protopolystoma xenopodis]
MPQFGGAFRLEVQHVRLVSKIPIFEPEFVVGEGDSGSLQVNDQPEKLDPAGLLRSRYSGGHALSVLKYQWNCLDRLPSYGYDPSDEILHLSSRRGQPFDPSSQTPPKAHADGSVRSGGNRVGFTGRNKSQSLPLLPNVAKPEAVRPGQEMLVSLSCTPSARLPLYQQIPPQMPVAGQQGLRLVKPTSPKALRHDQGPLPTWTSSQPELVESVEPEPQPLTGETWYRSPMCSGVSLPHLSPPRIDTTWLVSRSRVGRPYSRLTRCPDAETEEDPEGVCKLRTARRAEPKRNLLILPPSPNCHTCPDQQQNRLPRAQGPPACARKSSLYFNKAHTLTKPTNESWGRSEASLVKASSGRSIFSSRSFLPVDHRASRSVIRPAPSPTGQASALGQSDRMWLAMRCYSCHNLVSSGSDVKVRPNRAEREREKELADEMEADYEEAGREQAEEEAERMVSNWLGEHRRTGGHWGRYAKTGGQQLTGVNRRRRGRTTQPPMSPRTRYHAGRHHSMLRSRNNSTAHGMPVNGLSQVDARSEDLPKPHSAALWCCPEAEYGRCSGRQSLRQQ